MSTTITTMIGRSASFFLLFLLFTAVSSTTTEVRAGFWPPFSNSYAPSSSINVSLYTHIFYASLAATTIDTNFTVSMEELPLLTNFSTTLKTQNSELKTLLSIGGSLFNSSEFSEMAADVNQRKAFIASAIAFARSYNFDGLDFAWEFPMTLEDMRNLGVLLSEWRMAIEDEARNSSPPLRSPPLILTSTVYFSNHLLDAPGNIYYPVEAISQSVDWVNAMCFNFQGWNRGEHDHTLAHSALFDTTSQLSVSYGIYSWIDAGLPSNKLVMGIPLYGRSWILKNKGKNGIGATTVAFGPRQRMSNQTGVMAYFEIQKLLQENNAVATYDNATVSAYGSVGNIWISFDTPHVLEQKIRFAQQNQLLGYFLWPISFDSSTTMSMTASNAWQGHFTTINIEDGHTPPAPSQRPRRALPPSSLSVVSSAHNLSWSYLFDFIHCLLLFLVL